MIALFCFIWGVLRSPFKSTSRLEAENAALRQQVVVLQRNSRGRIELTNGDRMFFVLLYRWFPSILQAMTIVRPETVVRWHRAGFRRYWRWKSRGRGGRPPIQSELRALIRRMSVENVLWGAPRIQGELLKLGFTVAQSTVAKYMAKTRRSVRSALGHVPAQSCAAHRRDGFVCGPDHRLYPALCAGDCPAGAAASLSGSMSQDIRRRSGSQQQVTEAFPWDEAPRYLIRDRDSIYGTAVTRRLRAMGIRDKPIAPGSPWQNGYAERLIGTIRRECVDHLIVFGEAHLRRILREYAAYYNGSRTHRALNQDAPVHRPVQSIGAITSRPVLGGLHHQYCRI